MSPKYELHESRTTRGREVSYYCAIYIGSSLVKCNAAHGYSDISARHAKNEALTNLAKIINLYTQVWEEATGEMIDNVA